MSDLQHPRWCDRGATCDTGEHRGIPVTVTASDSADEAVIGDLTRLTDPAGRVVAEIRVRVALAPGTAAAVRHLVALGAELHRTVDRVAATSPDPLGGRL